MLSPISSRDNDKIKQACRLRDNESARRQAGLFFAEGPKLCLEAAKSCRCATLYATRRALDHTPELGGAGCGDGAGVRPGGGQALLHQKQPGGFTGCLCCLCPTRPPSALHGGFLRWNGCRTRAMWAP